MAIELKVTELRAFQKRISKLCFSLTPMPKHKGQYRLRVGKKYILIDCPSKEIGESVKAGLMAALKQTNDKVTQIIEYVEHNAEQITMELFPEERKGDDGAEGSISRS